MRFASCQLGNLSVFDHVSSFHSAPWRLARGFLVVHYPLFIGLSIGFRPDESSSLNLFQSDYDASVVLHNLDSFTSSFIRSYLGKL